MSELITKLFVEEPLALLGTAKQTHSKSVTQGEVPCRDGKKTYEHANNVCVRNIARIAKSCTENISSVVRCQVIFNIVPTATRGEYSYEIYEIIS